MRIVSITGQGLRWITGLVVLLWACVITEDLAVKHARRETTLVLSQLRQMREDQQRAVPVSHPLQMPRPYSKPAIG